MSIPPKSCSICATAARRAVRSRWSTTKLSHLPAAARTSCPVWSRSVFVAGVTPDLGSTVAQISHPPPFPPLRANAIAADLPMPRAAPVTTATFPLRISLHAESSCVICSPIFPENLVHRLSKQCSSFQPKISLSPRITYAPDAARTVICNVECAIMADGYSYRPTPDLSIRGDKSGKKILILAGGFAVLHGNPDNLVASTVRTVPGSVFRRESIAVVLGWEGRFTGRVKGHFERGHMGLNQDVRGNDLGLEFRMGAHKPRVLMTPHIKPGPTVEAPFLH